MTKILSGWRYYGLGCEGYHRSIDKVMVGNLLSLWIAGTWLAIFCFVQGTFAIIASLGGDAYYLTPRELGSISFYLGMGVAAAIFAAWMSRIRRKAASVSKTAIYAFIIFQYFAIVTMGVYMGVWSNPQGTATIVMVFLVCGMVTIAAPPAFNLLIILAATGFFVLSSVLFKDAPYWNYDIMNVMGTAPIAIVMNWVVSVHKMRAVHNERALAEERDKFQQESTVDELTGLRNRRDFDATFHRFLNSRSCENTGRFACLALLDIDHFKEYNDHYGHLAGDECLRSIGGVLGGLRDAVGIYAARIGGEEFAMLWFEEDSIRMKNVVLEAQRRICRLEITHENSLVNNKVTVSIGVYAIPCDSFVDADTVYNMADRALYDAKNMGRNCAVLYDIGKKYHMPAGDNL
ncbi:MAG: GGDEF domain-containing protein [Defluviitaleaceae bacterium]|nr:GGDEF domain-containing protein [Defluviitaleaceae bacterium]